MSSSLRTGVLKAGVQQAGVHAAGWGAAAGWGFKVCSWAGACCLALRLAPSPPLCPTCTSPCRSLEAPPKNLGTAEHQRGGGVARGRRAAPSTYSGGGGGGDQAQWKRRTQLLPPAFACSPTAASSCEPLPACWSSQSACWSSESSACWSSYCFEPPCVLHPHTPPLAGTAFA